VKKSFFALLLVLALLFSLCVTALAEDTYQVGDVVESDSEPAGTIPDNTYWERSEEDVLECAALPLGHQHDPVACYGGYICGLEDDPDHTHVNPGCYGTELVCSDHHTEDCYKTVTKWTLKASSPKPTTINVTVAVAYESALRPEDIGTVKLTVASQKTDGTDQSSVEYDVPVDGISFESTDRVMTFTMSGYERDGYECKAWLSNEVLSVGSQGGTAEVQIILDYWQEATIVLKKSFASESLLDAASAPETKLTLTSGAETLEATLNSENNWEYIETGKTFRAGSVWTVSQTQTVPTGYLTKSSLDEPQNQTVTLQPGENIIEVEDYFYKEGTLNVALNFDADSALQADDFPNGIEFEVTSPLGTASGTLNQFNDWQLIFLYIPYGDITWTLDLPDNTEYQLSSPTGGTFAFAEDNTDLELELLYAKNPGSFKIELHEQAYLIENGTLTATTVRDTGLESDSYSISISGANGSSVSLTDGQTATFNGYQGDSYTLSVSGGNYAVNLSQSSITIDDTTPTVDVYITYYYEEDTAPLAISGRVIDGTSGKALSGAGISFTPPANEGGAVGSAPGTVQTGADGVFSFPISYPGIYTLQETAAPKGYELNPTPVTVTVTENWSVETDSEGRKVITQNYIITHDGDVDDGGALVIKNKLLPTVDVSVEVKFVRDSTLQRPEKVTVVLYKDGVEYDRVTLTAKDNWYHKWEKLPGGYYYTADETAVPEGYIKYFVRDKNDITIVNSGTDIPVTGDDNGLLWAALGMLCLTGCAVLVRYRKKFE